MSIENNLIRIKERLGKNTKLIAISKTQPTAMVLACYNTGQKIFGENKVQELVEKHEALPKDIEWHMVGHLQSNKVKFIAPFVSLIHSVDSLKLLMEINKQGIRFNRVIPCLLQLYIASEETKFGLDEIEALELLNSEDFKRFSNVSLIGVMGMATNTNDKTQIRNEFKKLRQLLVTVRSNFSSTLHPFKEISMGMSSDYEIAIAEGSTMVRIGSSIFGDR